MDLPYLERRARLDELHLDGGPIRVPPTWIGEDPERMLRIASDAALEGIVDSPLDVEPPREIARSAHWCDPIVTVDVAYREVSGDGVLRQPSFKGVRSDVDVAEIGWPS